MKKPVFTGSGVALVTPFTRDGIDFKKMAELCEFHIRHQTDAIVVAGGLDISLNIDGYTAENRNNLLSGRAATSNVPHRLLM